ncbi:MAG: homoserine kinase [Oscillospiraceae bacterium]|jgi:homoserine kinase|nr:homoserine kinase [Oscillospiraceae bacterium]
MLKIKIPATSANLGAGFDSLGLSLGMYNEVYMEESDHVNITSLDDIKVPQNESNLIYISAKRVYDICGKSLSGLTIKQKNNIPMTRGLGSSSACIIAGLVGANHMLNCPFSVDELVNMAAYIEGHPDNTTPALLGGIVTAVFDTQCVYWVKQEVDSHLKFFALIPDFELRTEVARGRLPEQVSHKDAVFNLSRAALFSASLLSGKYENLKEAVHDRLHQPYRMGLIKGCEQVFEATYKLGAYATYISGAGPTIMSIVDGKNSLFGLQIRRQLDEIGLSTWKVCELSIDNIGAQVLEQETI